MAAIISKFGPGTLSIGEVGTAIDISCQIEFASVQWDKTKDDDVMVLCGDVVPGATTRTATLSGHIFQDTSSATGIVQASWGALKGQTVPFKFVPNTADDVQVAGEVTVEPITVGSGEAGANMASDFEWDIVGEPTLSTVP